MTSKKLSIAFISSKRYSFYPPDYVKRGLGGSESALVLLSRALARRGHRVEVYNCCFKPGEYEGVLWKPLWMFDPAEQRDVVVSLRLLETFEQDIVAPIRAVWIHDESLLGATEMDNSGRVNLWIAVSETEKSFILRNELIKHDHWFVTSNAFDEDIYNENLKKSKKISGQLIYCSAPDRGLKYLFEYWKEIKQQVPHARLLVTGSYALWGNADEENNRFFSDLYKKADNLKGVKLLGRISKKELALHQAKSELMVYPSVFDEMYCICALECFAVGTPVVSTARAALNERIINGETGFVINGHPSEREYRSKFIDTVVFLLKNKNTRSILSEKSKEIAKTENYRNLALKWEIKFKKILSTKKYNP